MNRVCVIVTWAMMMHIRVSMEMRAMKAKMVDGVSPNKMIEKEDPMKGCNVKRMKKR